MEESQKVMDEDRSQNQNTAQKVVPADFEVYLINALNDSLIKKSN